MAHIYNGISAKKRNETELFVVRWMDLESVIQSVISSGGRRNGIEGLLPAFKEFIIQGGGVRMRTKYLIVSKQVVGSCEKK